MESNYIDNLQVYETIKFKTITWMIIMKLPSVRRVNLVAFLVCCALIAFALYLEVNLQLKPCPLCITQRVIVMVLGLLFLFGALLNFQYKSYGRRIFHIIIAIVSLLGVVVAGRHIWLEMLPPGQVPTCGAGITYLLQMLPLTQALKLLFMGSGECGKVTWRFLGLSISMWTCLCFIGFTLLSLWQGFRRES